MTVSESLDLGRGFQTLQVSYRRLLIDDDLVGLRDAGMDYLLVLVFDEADRVLGRLEVFENLFVSLDLDSDVLEVLGNLLVQLG